MTIAENVKLTMPKTNKAKEFVLKIKEYSQSDIADKSIVGILMSELTTKKFDWSWPIRDHEISMINLATKLKSMGMDMSEYFLVQLLSTHFLSSLTKSKWRITLLRITLLSKMEL